MAKSPMVEALAYLRKRYDVVEKTEHWNAFAKRRQDLLGFADIMAIEGMCVVLYQVTTPSNTSARIRKIQASEKAKAWVQDDRHRGICVLAFKDGQPIERWICQDDFS